LRARLIDQCLDVVERDPGRLAAGGAPAFYRLEDRLGLLAAERPVDVDHQQGRALAEAGAGAEPAGGEHPFVALGQKLVPDRLAHRRSPPRGWRILRAEAGDLPLSREAPR